MERRFEFEVHGLACGGGGTRTIEKRISRLDGVIEVYVNPATAKAYITADDERVTPADLAEAARKAGFRPGPVRLLGPAR